MKVEIIVNNVKIHICIRSERSSVCSASYILQHGKIWLQDFNFINNCSHCMKC